MKKFYLLLVSLLVAVAANAAPTPLYTRWYEWLGFYAAMATRL